MIEIPTRESSMLTTLFTLAFVDLSRVQLEIYLRARSPVAIVGCLARPPFVSPFLDFTPTITRPSYAQ